MSIGKYIKTCIKEDGRTLTWVSEKLGINYKTFVGKLNRNTLSADELLKVGSLIDINLEHMKMELNFSSLWSDTKKYIYVAQNALDEDILNKDKILAKLMEVREESYQGNYTYNIVYAFTEVFTELGVLNYKIEKIRGNNLKEIKGNSSVYMLRISKDSIYYEKGEKTIGNIN